MQLGAGRPPDDALLFANLDGGPLQPSNVSSDWGELAERIGMPEITFHGLRHSHASQLIASGVDIVTRELPSSSSLEKGGARRLFEGP